MTSSEKRTSAVLAQRREGSRVEKRGWTILKFFRDNADAELRKHRWAEAALADTEAHYPTLLGIKGCNAEGALVMEYIDGLVSLRIPYLAFMKGKTDDLSNFGAAGRALGYLHSAMPLPARELPDPMPPLHLDTLPVLGSESVVLLHGDYGFSNVFWSETRDQIVVLDASPNHFMTSHPLQTGTRYVDLANFVSCLCGLVPPRHFAMMRWTRAPSVIEAFLNGYAATSHFTPDRTTVLRSAHQTANAYFGYSYPSVLRRVLARAWFATHVKLIGRHYERLSKQSR